MPTLLQSLYRLYSQDKDYPALVADLWDLTSLPSEADQALEALTQSLLDPVRLAAKVTSLPPEAQEALRALVKAGGRLPWAAFSRRYGEIRSMGPARREREQPHRHPISVSERLFYHALLFRAFFDTSAGPQEFVYLPQDLLPLLRRLFPEEPPAVSTLGRAARLVERRYVFPLSDALLDDLTTLLAALRLGRDPSQEHWEYPLHVMQALLETAGLIQGKEVQGEAVRSFLERTRTEALIFLQQAWLHSRTFNELRLLPHLLFEGEWENPAWETRQRVLGFLAMLPTGEWWHLPSFIQAIKEHFPDFQRPAGEYDSWFIRRRSDGRYLRGFISWDEVEGVLLRFFVLELLPMLGIVERAAPSADEEIVAFRIHPSWQLQPGEEGYCFHLEHPLPFPAEDAKVVITSQGRLRLSPQVPRKVRYLLARMAEWEGRVHEEYRYRLTVASLRRAQAQGLKAEHLIAILRQHGAGEIPPNLLKALERWGRRGTEISLEEHILLRLENEQLAETLRHSAAARFLGEPLGPKTFLVPRASARKLLEVLLTLGWLVEDKRREEKGPEG